MKTLIFCLLLFSITPIVFGATIQDCEKRVKKCISQPNANASDVNKCFDKEKINEDCKPLVTVNDNLTECSKLINDKCPNMSGDKLIACLKKANVKACTKSLESEYNCPPYPCCNDFKKCDADIITKCNMDYRDANPNC
jgi:hypothetical protein